jgi:hypothetical protein
MDCDRVVIVEGAIPDEREMRARWHAWTRVWDYLLSDPPTEENVSNTAGAALVVVPAFFVCL